LQRASSRQGRGNRGGDDRKEEEERRGRGKKEEKGKEEGEEGGGMRRRRRDLREPKAWRRWRERPSRRRSSVTSRNVATA